ncbi:hypothetical protein BBJ28_00014850 [Nothophytophthora sp. Chile5]|nr:hypothetical protein BBJ28_00014850 [Nothophytophthora sp. Chile5]
MESAILARDFEAFGTLTMQESNQFHATCLDTTPPIFYLNDVSRQIIRLVHRYNTQAGRIQAAYTFDAGPNAVLFVEQEHVQELVALVLHCFPSSPEMAIKSSMALDRKAPQKLLARMEAPLDGGKVFTLPKLPGSVKMLYVSRVGGGTRVLSENEALIDGVTGEPLPFRTEETANEAEGGCLSAKSCFWTRLLSASSLEPALRYAAVAIVAAAATRAVLLHK